MTKNVLLTTFLGIAFITILTGIIIFLARGYTFNPRSGKIQKTGIMVITSEPSNAAVYIDGELKDTTNTTINFLTPGTYTIKITKDGFTDWQKQVEVKPELVTRLDVILFPQVPDLHRLTFLGVSNVWPTADGNHAVYYVTDKLKKGLWVMSLSDAIPLVNNDPIQIYADTGTIDLANANYTMAPDGKSMLVTDNSKPTPVYYLLDLTRVNDNLVAQTEDDIRPTILSWYDSYYAKETNLRDRLVNSVRDIPSYEHPHPDLTSLLHSINTVLDQTALSAPPLSIASPSAKPSPAKSIKPTPSPSPSATATPGTDQSADSILAKINLLVKNDGWSPKQDRVLFQNNGQNQIYDLQTGAFYTLPKADSIKWLPTDAHVILVNPNGKKGEIAVADFDGSNQIVLFSGQFVDSIAIPWTSGTKLVVLTNLNQATGSDPNLYAITLR